MDLWVSSTGCCSDHLSCGIGPSGDSQQSTSGGRGRIRREVQVLEGPVGQAMGLVDSLKRDGYEPWAAGLGAGVLGPFVPFGA